MPNELPKQLYVARFVLTCGAIFDVVTELTAEEIRELKTTAIIENSSFVIPGINPTQKWPVEVEIHNSQFASMIHAPHEQWLVPEPTMAEKIAKLKEKKQS